MQQDVVSEASRLEADFLSANYAQAMREMARRDIGAFNEYCFGWPRHAVPLHNEWHQHIESCIRRGKNAGLMAPRDHGKTQQIARARVLWELGRSTEPRLAWKPNIRIKLFQNTDQKASETVQQIERDVQMNPRIREVFPRLAPDREGEWNKHQMFITRTENLRDASFEGMGIGSSATSGRADLIILDDVCDFKNAIAEPSSRARIITAHDSVIANLKEPGSPTVAIATAWHEQDLNSELQRREGWDWKVYRIQPEPGGPMVPLWTPKWDVPQLEARRNEIGHREFERMFNNRPWGEEEALVDWKSVERCMRPDLALGDIPDGEHLVSVAVGYDLAISMRDDAAYFAAVVLGLIGGGRVIPLEFVRKRLPFRQQIETALRLEAKWRPTVHVVENNAFQQAFIDQLVTEDAYLAVQAFTTGKQKFDPEIGLPSLAPAFEAGQWIIPTAGGHDGNAVCECPECVWLKEMRYFPGASSDLLMASWFAFSRLRLLTAGAGDIHIESASMASIVEDEPDPFEHEDGNDIADVLGEF